MSNEQKAKDLLKLIEGVTDASEFIKLESEITHYEEDKYPDLEFNFSLFEKSYLSSFLIANELNWKGIISHVKQQDSGDSALIKLLLSHLWKQGDFKKNKHILRGILTDNEDEYPEKEGIVFYYFGKHLSNPLLNPIIDRNIIGFWRWYSGEFKESLDNYRYGVTLKDKDIIDSYISFFRKEVGKFQGEFDAKYKYSRLIDKSIFSFVKEHLGE